MLVIFSGCSGVGKNTVINKLMSENDSYRLLPTYTTRDMRPGEREGMPYHFISDEQFEQKIAQGEFYEYERVHNHYYGTSRKLLAKGVESKKILVKDIDVNGALNLSEILKDDVHIVTLFLYVESADVLVERLIGRGEKDIELRLRRYEHEMSKKKYYSYLIDNKSLEETAALAEELIAFEGRGGRLCSTVSVCDADPKRIAEAEKLFESGEIPEPVKVSVKDGRFVITEGLERYIAAARCKKSVAKDLTLVTKALPACFELEI